MKKKYVSPTTCSYVLQDYCSQLVTATVVNTQGDEAIDHFDVNENSNPDGNDDAWWDNPDNWGGD